MRRYGSKQPSKASRRVALQMVLLNREELGALSVESLVRSYGLPANEVIGAIEAEKKRRAA